MRTRQRALGVAVGLLFWVVPALAEPYIAVREGMRCSACHTNMTGGGKRTDLVSTHARDILHYPTFLGTFSNPPEFFNGTINQYLSVGTDLRVSDTAIFQDGQTNPATGTVTTPVRNDQVFRGRLEQNNLDVTEGVLYGEVRLIPDYLTFYTDEQVQPTTDNREAFGLLTGVLPWGGYVKAGRMFLPYGLQLQDDGAFIRQGTNGSAGTGFSFQTQEAGAEIGFEPGPFTFITAVTNGSAGDRSVRVTSTGYTMFTDLPAVRNLMLGSSFSHDSGTPSSEQWRYCVFAGSNLGRFTYLGEADFLRDRNPSTDGRTIGRFIAYGEGDYLLFGWLNLKVAVDYADNDGHLLDTGDSENRVSIGLEPFLNRFVQPRLFYRVSNGIRSDPTHNQSVIFGEVHLFL